MATEAPETSDETGASAIFGALFQAHDMVQVGASVTTGSENGQLDRVGGGFSSGSRGSTARS